jgi:hypothetical protein
LPDVATLNAFKMQKLVIKILKSDTKVTENYIVARKQVWNGIENSMLDLSMYFAFFLMSFKCGIFLSLTLSVFVSVLIMRGVWGAE